MYAAACALHHFKEWARRKKLGDGLPSDLPRTLWYLHDTTIEARTAAEARWCMRRLTSVQHGPSHAGRLSLSLQRAPCELTEGPRSGRGDLTKAEDLLNPLIWLCSLQL